MQGTPALMARIAYGGGLRVLELVRLRVKDVDTARLRLQVRSGKGDKDHITTLAGRTVQDLLGHAKVDTTRIYLHVMQKPGLGGRSLLDGLLNALRRECGCARI